jgi:hypothetical protein
MLSPCKDSTLAVRSNISESEPYQGASVTSFTSLFDDRRSKVTYLRCEPIPSIPVHRLPLPLPLPSYILLYFISLSSGNDDQS